MKFNNNIHTSRGNKCFIKLGKVGFRVMLLCYLLNSFTIMAHKFISFLKQLVFVVLIKMMFLSLNYMTFLSKHERRMKIVKSDCINEISNINELFNNTIMIENDDPYIFLHLHLYKFKILHTSKRN